MDAARSLLQESPVKITISGVPGVWLDETAYDGLLETIRILQENPTITHSLKEREAGVFVDEEDIMNIEYEGTIYVLQAFSHDLN